MAFLSIEEENYVRMSLLLTGISPRAVRTKFDHEFAPACLDASLKNEYTKLLDLKKQHRINQSQWNLLFPRFPDVPDSKTFDVTLMTTLLRNLIPMTSPLCGFDKLPPVMETTPAADLARIKHYRNYLAHLDDGQIDITFFNTAWDDITNAIERLGGQQMKQECIHMKTKPLDQTNQEIMRDIKHSNDEIRDLKESIESLKRSHEVVSKEMAEIKFSRMDSVPLNIRAQHNLEIKEWENDEATFFETRGTRHIFASIPSNNCIVVTGSSGCGKSSNIHHAALHLRDNFGYEIIPVLTGPTDIMLYNNVNSKQVFVVDDICGKESMNIQTFKNWRDNEEKIEKLLKTVKNEVGENVADSKLLISCRSQIYKESLFQLIKLLTRKECDLLSPELCLQQEEKIHMVKKYLPKNIIDNVMEMKENVDFFPLVCKMSKGKKTSEEVVNLFTAPVESIMNNLRHIVTENKTQFCVLVVCILYDDGFNTDWLNLNVISEKKMVKLEDILKEFEIDVSKEISRNSLKTGLATLVGTYIKQIGTEYRIIHDRIRKMAAIICGQYLPECFIKYAPSIIIRDHFILESISAEVPRDLIIISEDNVDMYFDRLLSDLKEFIITSTFHNTQLVYKPFRDTLIRIFGQSDTAKQIIKDFVPKLKKMTTEADFFFWNEMLTLPLIESVTLGYNDIVLFLIDTVKCDVNVRDKSGRSLLYLATERGNTNVVKVILENKIDMLICESSRTCPFYVACAQGFTDIVNLLLQNRVNLTQSEIFRLSLMECEKGHAQHRILPHQRFQSRDSRFHIHRDRDFPLFIACEGGHLDIVKLLLTNNADVFICNSLGDTPLYMACKGGNIDIVKLLLQNNAVVSHVRISNNMNKSALHAAYNGGYTDIIKMLLQNSDVSYDFDDLEIYYILRLECEKGHTELLELLLKKTVDINRCYCFEKNTLLHVVCSKGHANIANLLLKNKADISQCNSEGESPLYLACANGHTDVVETLLQYNADVSQCKNNGQTPFQAASANGHINIENILLQNKAGAS